MQTFRWAAVSAVCLATLELRAQSFEGTESFASMLGKIDVTCILKTWRINGVRVCVKKGKPVACVVVENAYPVGILEAVKHTWSSHLKEFEPVARALSKVTKSMTSSHGPDGNPTSGLCFFESRAFMFVPRVSSSLPIAVPPHQGFGVSFVSEADAFEYRRPLVEMFLKAPSILATLPTCDVVWPKSLAACCGNWGSYYARSGFINHPSSVIAGYVDAMRAGRIASDPPPHVVLGPYPYEPRTGHYVQPVRPKLEPCLKIGSPLLLKVEKGKGSVDQTQLLIHFGVFEECKPCWGARLVEPRMPR